MKAREKWDRHVELIIEKMRLDYGTMSRFTYFRYN